MPNDLKNMSIEDLEALKRDLSKKRDELHEKARVVARVLDEKLAEQAAAAKIAAMSPIEKKKMAQLISAESAETGENTTESGVS